MLHDASQRGQGPQAASLSNPHEPALATAAAPSCALGQPAHSANEGFAARGHRISRCFGGKCFPGFQWRSKAKKRHKEQQLLLQSQRHTSIKKLPEVFFQRQQAQQLVEQQQQVQHQLMRQQLLQQQHKRLVLLLGPHGASIERSTGIDGGRSSAGSSMTSEVASGGGKFSTAGTAGRSSSSCSFAYTPSLLDSSPASSTPNAFGPACSGITSSGGEDSRSQSSNMYLLRQADSASLDTRQWEDAAGGASAGRGGSEVAKMHAAAFKAADAAVTARAGSVSQFKGDAQRVREHAPAGAPAIPLETEASRFPVTQCAAAAEEWDATDLFQAANPCSTNFSEKSVALQQQQQRQRRQVQQQEATGTRQGFSLSSVMPRSPLAALPAAGGALPPGEAATGALAAPDRAGRPAVLVPSETKRVFRQPAVTFAPELQPQQRQQTQLLQSAEVQEQEQPPKQKSHLEDVEPPVLPQLGPNAAVVPCCLHLPALAAASVAVPAAATKGASNVDANNPKCSNVQSPSPILRERPTAAPSAGALNTASRTPSISGSAAPPCDAASGRMTASVTTPNSPAASAALTRMAPASQGKGQESRQHPQHQQPHETQQPSWDGEQHQESQQQQQETKQQHAPLSPSTLNATELLQPPLLCRPPHSVSNSAEAHSPVAAAVAAACAAHLAVAALDAAADNIVPSAEAVVSSVTRGLNAFLTTVPASCTLRSPQRQHQRQPWSLDQNRSRAGHQQLLFQQQAQKQHQLPPLTLTKRSDSPIATLPSPPQQSQQPMQQRGEHQRQQPAGPFDSTHEKSLMQQPLLQQRHLLHQQSLRHSLMSSVSFPSAETQQQSQLHDILLQQSRFTGTCTAGMKASHGLPQHHFAASIKEVQSKQQHQQTVTRPRPCFGVRLSAEAEAAASEAAGAAAAAAAARPYCGNSSSGSRCPLEACALHQHDRQDRKSVQHQQEQCCPPAEAASAKTDLDLVAFGLTPQSPLGRPLARRLSPAGQHAAKASRRALLLRKHSDSSLLQLVSAACKEEAWSQKRLQPSSKAAVLAGGIAVAAADAAGATSVTPASPKDVAGQKLLGDTTLSPSDPSSGSTRAHSGVSEFNSNFKESTLTPKLHQAPRRFPQPLQQPAAEPPAEAAAAAYHKRPSTPVRAERLRKRLEMLRERGQLSKETFPAEEVAELVNGAKIVTEGPFQMYVLDRDWTLGCNALHPEWPQKMLQNTKEGLKLHAEINRLLALAKEVRVGGPEDHLPL